MIKTFLVLAIGMASLQSMAFTIECLSQENLQASRLGLDSLKIVVTRDKNTLIINDVVTPLGDRLPVRMNPLARVSLQSESLTVIKAFKLGESAVFPAGSELSYLHNRMELRKWKDTQVTLKNFSQRVKLVLDCQMQK